MNFDEAKYQVVQAIKNKNFRHERRKSQAQKNLLANDEISQAEAIAIIEKTRGTKQLNRSITSCQTRWSGYFDPTTGISSFT